MDSTHYIKMIRQTRCLMKFLSELGLKDPDDALRTAKFYVDRYRIGRERAIPSMINQVKSHRAITGLLWHLGIGELVPLKESKAYMERVARSGRRPSPSSV